MRRHLFLSLMISQPKLVAIFSNIFLDIFLRFHAKFVSRRVRKPVNGFPSGINPGSRRRNSSISGRVIRTRSPTGLIRHPYTEYASPRCQARPVPASQADTSPEPPISNIRATKADIISEAHGHTSAIALLSPSSGSASGSDVRRSASRPLVQHLSSLSLAAETLICPRLQ
jgi:hypothetical protein